ncbi:MAG: biotin carboxyl carrier protein [Candidatus Westeberhardia cardiocondylae]|nr:biotin carboxyl carrier protein [Candidatus Westeberhardia cardiocondylae]
MKEHYMDIRKIKKLIELVEQSNIFELEFSKGEESVRINRVINDIHKVSYNKENSKDVCMHNNKDRIMSKYTIASNISEDMKSSSALRTNGHLVCSPMVGIFYRSMGPDIRPFVEIDNKVNIGDTLCIIEAMKTMHRVQSDMSGIVKRIFVNDGLPVEFDEPLFLIK